MLPALMRTRVAAIALCVLTALVLAGALSACGAGNGSDESEVAEGEPIALEGLEYNVQITRFLNPDDTEDTEYLVGMPPPPPGREYLGVFLVITNLNDEARPSASNYVVTDTLDNEYDLLESTSPYALEVGSDVPGDGQLPNIDSTAGTGPNQGSLLIFEVDDSVSDNRPLQMEIETFGDSGEVTLDI
jgi:hypothetical protein